MDAKQQKKFLGALEEMTETNGISQDVVIDAIKEAFTVAWTKKLEDSYNINKNQRVIKSKNKDGEKLSDALIKCDIDLKKGTINLARQWNVLNDDDINDDFIEISTEDERAKAQHLNAGDIYEENIDLSSFTKGDVGRFISIYKQKISKAQKDALYETFSGKIGQIINGSVEKSDPHSVLVNLGREGAYAYLYQRDLIGNEKFNVGDNIKVFVEGISVKGEKKEGFIKISRSCPGFLQKLFENEIHEIFDGTVIIKNVARLAGVRSKVVVYSNDPNVDASGACIGQNGSRIQSIALQLGNNKEYSEKVDVIAYNDNLGLYLAECLKPGVVVGMNIDLENQKALVVCADEKSKLAIGLGGANVTLAKRLTGLKDIEIIDESDAKKNGIEARSIEEFRAEARESERLKAREASIKKANEAALNKPVDETTKIDKVEDFLSKDEDIEENEDTISLDITDSNGGNEVVKEAEPVKEEKVIERTVKTTISYESLEANLEKEKKEKAQSQEPFDYKKKSYKKDDKKADKPVVKESTKENEKKNIQKMDIYTKEELEELEKENALDVDEKVEDFSEWDDDSYYEDK